MNFAKALAKPFESQGFPTALGNRCKIWHYQVYMLCHNRNMSTAFPLEF